jgi:HD-like signal output (HDOD) protein/FixJ family two-component response regulator
MKILIVDDEAVSRAKLKLIMETFGGCETVGSGKDALTAFIESCREKDPFDLIMLDIGLPDKAGTRVLSEIRAIEKELLGSYGKKVKILMVTSMKDKNSIITSIQSGCNDYIVKPFDLNIVTKKLEKIGIQKPVRDTREPIEEDPLQTTTEQIFGDISEMLNIRNINLPTLPRIRSKFQTMIKTGAVFQKIADLLKKDVAISAELIRLSNSAFYRGVVENKSLEQAISRLGFAVAEQVVDEICDRKFLLMEKKKYRTLVENVLKHSLACAYAAEFISTSLNFQLAGDPFTLGLLHDIGKLALFQIIADMEHKNNSGDEIPLEKIMSTIDDYHCLFGAKLLEKWKYADIYVHTAMNHDSMSQADQMPRELQIVQLADMISKSIGCDLTPVPSKIELSQIEYDGPLDLPSSVIFEIQVNVKEKMEADIAELFG